MSNVTAESLAKEVLERAYIPSEFEECESILPIDSNPHVVRYTQIFLFSNVEQSPAQEPTYLTFNFNHKTDREAVTRDIVNPMAEKLTRDLLTPDLPTADAPIDQIRETVRDIRQKLPAQISSLAVPQYGFELLEAIRAVRSSGPPFPVLGLPNLELSEDELRGDYETWLEEQRRQELLNLLEPWEKAGFISLYELPAKVEEIKTGLSDLLTRILLPPPFRPTADPQPEFAICAIFEQEWQQKGYTRGELINTLSLAPGEQLTLEIHSWDKTTIKNEDELLSEQELRVSENLTERDIQKVVRESSWQQGSSFTLGLSIPIPETPITVDPGVETSTNITEGLSKTNERTHERTREASNTLKNSRKTRIEVARDIGREQKQTRTIANTNRCHTLNCHYFEVMSNYLVTTRLVSIEPCLLFPNPKENVTPAWVLCHEDVLRKVLLDKTFLPGFEAAKLLQIAQQRLISKIPPISFPHMADSNGALQEELERQQNQILAGYRELQEALIAVKKTLLDGLEFAVDPRAWALYVAAKSGLIRLRRVLYFALLHANDVAIYALSQLDKTKDQGNPIASLSNFFSSTSLREFQFNTVDETVLWKGLERLGLPKNFVNALLGSGILDLTDLDDAGLVGDVSNAAQVLYKPPIDVDETGGVPGGSPPGGGPTGGQPPTQPDVLGTGQEISQWELWKAQVEFGQLKCHLEFHWPHYFHAVWSSQHPDERYSRLQATFGSIATIIRNEILTFHENKAAYLVANFDELKAWLAENLPDMEEMEEEIEKIKEQVKTTEPQPQLITLPTPGTVLEATVGQCDVCEDFIQQSRLTDLRVQVARAKREESEADRYVKRVESGDYSDPQVPESGKFVVKIEKQESE